MYSKMPLLRFASAVVQQPIVCKLARDYDLILNILNVTILPRNDSSPSISNAFFE